MASLLFTLLGDMLAMVSEFAVAVAKRLALLVFVLWLPDGGVRATPNMPNRARQSMILQLGQFLYCLCVIHSEGNSWPTRCFPRPPVPHRFRYSRKRTNDNLMS